MKRVVAFWICCLCASVTYAQDIHFSQFFAAPILVNPANTGNFIGSARIGLNYRDQWGSVTIPYRTFSAYADAGIQPKKAVNRFGIGLAALTDVAGDGSLTTNKLYLSSAYHIGYTEHDAVRFAVGISGGMVQKTIDISKLYFDTQWDGFEFDTSTISNETFSTTTINYPDINIGAMLTILPYKGRRIFVGASASHINKPNESFFGETNELGIKFTATAGGSFATAGVANFQPQVYVSTQKSALEVIAGSNISIPMDVEGNINNAIFIGAWYRYGDAAWLCGGFIADNFTASVSYDFNLSKLRTASSTMGGLEIAAAYVFGNTGKKDPLKCPAY